MPGGLIVSSGARTQSDKEKTMSEQHDTQGTNTYSDEQERSSSSYDLFILTVTLISLAIMVIFYLPGIGAETKRVAFFLDTLICVILMFDFFRSLIRAPDKLAYLKWGWLDFLGSLPALPAFRLFRLWRLVRLVRILRRMSIRQLWRTFTGRRAESTLMITVLLVILVLGFASFTIVFFEAPAREANITTAADAIWWSLVSMTTVGYGDRFPVTEQGRLVAVLLMLVGIALFSVLTSYLSSGFIAPEKDKARGGDRQEDELAQMRARLEAIEQQLRELNQRLSEQA
jgi:voltage-gated potassium channel